MKITQTIIEMQHLFGQMDELNDILRCVICPQRKLELRYKKAELTGDYWRLKQDRQREMRL